PRARSRRTVPAVSRCLRWLTFVAIALWPGAGELDETRATSSAGPPPGAQFSLFSEVSHWSMVHDVALSDDGAYVVTGSGDGTVRFWDAQSGRQIWSLTLPPRTVVGPFTSESSQVESIVLAPALRVLVTVSSDNAVRFWQPRSGALLRQLPGTYYPRFAASPDSRYVGMYEQSRSVTQIVDLVLDRIVHEVAGGGVPEAISSDGQRYLTVRSDD